MSLCPPGTTMGSGRPRIVIFTSMPKSERTNQLYGGIGLGAGHDETSGLQETGSIMPA